MPYVEAVGVLSEDRGELAVFSVNRNLEEAVALDVDLRDFSTARVVEHIALTHSDLKAVNTLEQPDRVAPSALDNSVEEHEGKTRIALPPASWNVVRFSLEA